MSATLEVLVGLPVVVAHDPTTGRWRLEVHLAELADALSEAGEDDPEAESVLAAVAEAWAAFVATGDPVASCPIALVPTGT